MRGCHWRAASGTGRHSAAESTFHDQLAAIDDAPPSGTDDSATLAADQVTEWDAEETAADTENTALANAQATFLGAQYADQVTAMNWFAQSSAESSLPWVQYRDGLAAAKQAWWTSQGLTDYQNRVTQDNSARDQYQLAVDAKYTMLEATIDSAQTADVQAVDAADLAQQQSLDAADDQETEAMADAGCRGQLDQRLLRLSLDTEAERALGDFQGDCVREAMSHPNESATSPSGEPSVFQGSGRLKHFRFRR